MTPIKKFLKWLKRRFTPELGRWAVAFFLFIISYLVWGCAATPVKEYYPVYKDVLVPVPCDVTLPIKPAFTGDAAVDNLNILKYALELDISLRVCLGSSW